MARAVMVFGAAAALVVMPREGYARLGAATHTAASRAYTLIDRHILKPILTASNSHQEPEHLDAPAPRPAIRPSLLGEGARRGLDDVRIPPMTPSQSGASLPKNAGKTAQVADEKSALPLALPHDEASPARMERDASGAVIAKASDAQPPIALPVTAESHSSVSAPPVPLRVAVPPAETSQAVLAIDADQATARADSAAGEVVAKATIAADPVAEPAVGQPPVPSAKPEVPADKRHPPAAKLLFGAVKSAAPLAARSIGFYSRGCLSGAKALPIDGPAWQAMRLSRNRNWGHPDLIALLERFAKEVQKDDGWSGLLVGDISQPRGGPMLTGHASHQVGLDADIWFTPMPGRRLSRRERETLSATSMILEPTKIDPTAFTPSHVRVVKRAASYPEVERILVHPAIKKQLCEAAGTDRKWLSKVRPYFGHYYHFHVRIGCPKDSKDCLRQPAPDGDDGCGKELDYWFKRLTRPAPPKPKDAKPTPPKPPITLAEMPKECRVVLEAAGGPSTQDEAELVKTSIERSQHIIDISGVPRAKLLQRKAQQ